MRLQEYRPLTVVAIGKTTTAPHARNVLAGSGLAEIPFRVVAFPGRPEHKATFHCEMDAILREAYRHDILWRPRHPGPGYAAEWP